MTHAALPLSDACGPQMAPARHLLADIHILPAILPVPGLGVLPVNAHLIDGPQPLLIDTGLAAVRAGFLEALRGIVAPSRLRWIWITHCDADHVGNLAALLEAAPEARIVTTFLGMGKMVMQGLPPERMVQRAPGQDLDVGGRVLTALAPPSYDAPETTAVWDAASASLFSADCLGALLPGPDVPATAAEIDAATLAHGLNTWAHVDAPWLGNVDRLRWTAAVDTWRALDARAVLGSHLPPAFAMTDTLLDLLSRAPDAAAVAA